MHIRTHVSYHLPRVKGFVYTGSVLFLSLALIVSANYLLLAKKNQESGVVEKLRIDKAFNRYVDAVRIANKAVQDGVNDGATCDQKAILIDSYLNAALSSALLDSGGFTVTYSASVTNTCAAPIKFITVSVSFTVEDAAQTMHKEGTFGTTFQV